MRPIWVVYFFGSGFFGSKIFWSRIFGGKNWLTIKMRICGSIKTLMTGNSRTLVRMLTGITIPVKINVDRNLTKRKCSNNDDHLDNIYFMKEPFPHTLTLKSYINSYINDEKSADRNSLWRISCFNVYLQSTYCNCVSYVSFVTSYDHCYHKMFAFIV